MKKFLYIGAILGILLISLFSQTSKREKFREINDILYVENSEVQNDLMQRLNFVLPTNTKNAPLLLWIGGGAWSYVDRKIEMDLARKFASEGIAVASVGHRLSSATWRNPKLKTDIKHPAHIKDIASAFKWLHKNAEKYGYDKKKIFVGGYSSGGHLAALLTLDEKYLKAHGLSLKNIKGTIPIAGAYDIENYHQVFANGTRKELAKLHVEAVFGEISGFKEASPTSYVKNLDAPMLLISETNTYNYTKIFEDKLRKTGSDKFEVLHVRDLDHAGLWRDLSFNKDSIYRKRIVEFIKN